MKTYAFTGNVLLQKSATWGLACYLIRPSITQIRPCPCLEYGSHLWIVTSKHSLATLDVIQKRSLKLIGDPALTNSLDWLTEELFLHFPCTTDTIMVSVQSSWNQLSPLKPSLLETRGFRTLSTPSLSNWIKIEPALSKSLLSLWPPETVELTSSHRLPRDL